jgi:hypothetical protein
VPVPDWIARLHSRYSSADAAAPSTADKGDLMARSTFKKSKGGSPFGGKQAMPFGKKKTGKAAPAQKALMSGRSMSGGGR